MVLSNASFVTNETIITSADANELSANAFHTVVLLKFLIKGNIGDFNDFIGVIYYCE